MDSSLKDRANLHYGKRRFLPTCQTRGGIVKAIKNAIFSCHTHLQTSYRTWRHQHEEESKCLHSCKWSHLIIWEKQYSYHENLHGHYQGPDTPSPCKWVWWSRTLISWASLEQKILVIQYWCIYFHLQSEP